MTNSLHKKIQRGFVTLGIVFILLIGLSLAVFFTASAIISEQKQTSNIYRTHQAYDAAQAGIEYGINYLNTNYKTVTNGQTLTGTLANGSNYTIVLNFIGATYDIINIQSTGVSADGSSTKIVKQIVKQTPLISNAPQVPVIAKGNIALAGNSEIQNLESNTTIYSGGTPTISGTGETILASGVSSSVGVIGPDIVYNVGTLATMSSSVFELTYLGSNISQMQQFATISYSNSSSYNYKNDINGLTGEVVWINQTGGTANVNANITVGSPTLPVTIIVNGDLSVTGGMTLYGNLIVNGNFSMAGTAVINGMVFVTGDAVVGVAGTVQVNGAAVVQGNFESNGNAVINYSSTTLNQALTGGGGYGKISGGWQDLNN